MGESHRDGGEYEWLRSVLGAEAMGVRSDESIGLGVWCLTIWKFPGRRILVSVIEMTSKI